MGRNLFSSDNIIETAKNLSNAAGLPLVNLDAPEEYHVSIRPDNSVAPAKFIPDPLIHGGWKAHELTIRAMRKEIFTIGEGFEDLEKLYTCRCGQTLDLQFWNFCPFCEAHFPRE